jgi:hypothetical protein
MNNTYCYRAVALLAALAAAGPLSAPAHAQYYKSYPNKPVQIAPPNPFTTPAKGTLNNNQMPTAGIPGIGNPFGSFPGTGFNNTPFGTGINSPIGAGLNSASSIGLNPNTTGLSNFYAAQMQNSLSPFNPITQYQMGQLNDYMYFGGAGAYPYGPPPYGPYSYGPYAPIVSQFGYYGNPWSPYPPYAPYVGYQFGPWMTGGPRFPWDLYPQNPFNQQNAAKPALGGPDPVNILK